MTEAPEAWQIQRRLRRSSPPVSRLPPRTSDSFRRPPSSGRIVPFTLLKSIADMTEEKRPADSPPPGVRVLYETSVFARISIHQAPLTHEVTTPACSRTGGVHSCSDLEAIETLHPIDCRAGRAPGHLASVVSCGRRRSRICGTPGQALHPLGLRSRDPLGRHWKALHPHARGRSSVGALRLRDIASVARSAEEACHRLSDRSPDLAGALSGQGCKASSACSKRVRPPGRPSG